MTTTMTAEHAHVTVTGYGILCWDSGNGSHNNTTQTVYSGAYYLRCAHNDDILTGTYISPLYDIGASGRYLIYVLADVVVTGAGVTWDDLVPAGVTWAQMGSITWDALCNLSAGPVVKIAVVYGDANPPTSRVDKMEILSAIVTGRYFRVEIEITDPSEEIAALVENFTLKFCQ